MILGLLGASLFYGDGVITPAISVLSAVEGLKVLTPELSHWVVPLTVLILIGCCSSCRAAARRGSAPCSARSC